MEKLNIPQEIREEILSRLPVKSLIRFRCVCKLWLTLISSSQFVKTHLIKNSKSNRYANYNAIIPHINSSTNELSYYAYSLYSILYDGTSPINAIKQIDLPMTHPKSPVFVIGSCNGLLCYSYVSESRYAYFLFNPALKKLHQLPFPSISNELRHTFTNGFWYDEVNDDYKVVRLGGVDYTRDYGAAETMIYSLKNNCWRNIKNRPKWATYCMESGVLVSKKLYWVTYGGTGNAFISLDMATEEFGKVAHPKHGYRVVDSLEWTLLESRGHLYSFAHVYREKCFHVWEMKEYGVEEESWTKLGSIMDSIVISGIVLPLYPFFVTENGDVVLKSSICVVSYNLKYSKFEGHKFYDNVHYGAYISLPNYIESLVPPNFDG